MKKNQISWYNFTQSKLYASIYYISLIIMLIMIIFFS